MNTQVPWSEYPNFSKKEFDCQETGENRMQPYFLNELQALRDKFGRPMRVTSGYRSPKHSIEARKASPGTHAMGCAVDISVHGEERWVLLKLAFEMGRFHGIGIDKNFIHLDMYMSRKAVWTY